MNTLSAALHSRRMPKYSFGDPRDITARPIRLIGGHYDGRWWNDWRGEPLFCVRFPPPATFVAPGFDPDADPSSTVNAQPQNYKVGFIYADGDECRLAFAYPLTWSERDALLHLLGNPI